MEISKKLIQKLARLGGLDLNENELDIYVNSLKSMDQFMSKLEIEKLEGVKPLVHLDQDHMEFKVAESNDIGEVSTQFFLDRININGNN